jgi:hypothetical protein
VFIPSVDIGFGLVAGLRAPGDDEVAGSAAFLREPIPNRVDLTPGMARLRGSWKLLKAKKILVAGA